MNEFDLQNFLSYELNLTPQLHKNNNNKIFKIKVALSYFQINYSTTFPLLSS